MYMEGKHYIDGDIMWIVNIMWIVTSMFHPIAVSISALYQLCGSKYSFLLNSIILHTTNTDPTSVLL